MYQGHHPHTEFHRLATKCKTTMIGVQHYVQYIQICTVYSNVNRVGSITRAAIRMWTCYTNTGLLLVIDWGIKVTKK